ncbi:MAG: SUMF1/EgtB/PvdO family nonheme iron enzyme [Thermodesulfobacteriota bacterium]
MDSETGREGFYSGVNRVLNFFRFSRDSGLLFCTCDSGELISSINREILEKATGLNLEIKEVDLTTEDLFNFLARMRDVASRRPNGVIVNGLDGLIALSEKSRDQTSFLETLNISRESLIHLAVPLLFWTSERNVSLLANKAPDIFIRRDRGVIFFSEASLRKEISQIERAIKEQERQQGNIAESILETTLSALRAQRDHLRDFLGPSFKAELIRSGAIAQGKGAKALGDRAINVDGQVRDSIIAAGEKVEIKITREGKKRVSGKEALKRYREYVAENCGHLPMRGIDIGASDPTSGRERMDLAQVYIGLNTKTAVPGKKGKRSEESLRVPGEEETRPLTALAAAVQNRRMVLLGDPGSGKTTFVNHLAFCLAGHGLDSGKDWLGRIPGWPEKEGDLVPVPVVLKDFAASAGGKKAKAQPKDLWDFIVDRLEAQNMGFAVDPVEMALDRGEAIVLLDGLDEIQDKSNHGFVRDAILAFGNRYKKIRMVATCRVLSYQEKSVQLEGIPSFELAPFNDEMIDAFIRAWYAELRRLDVMKSQEEAEGMTHKLQEAVRRPDIRRLATNPLLLTVMALVNTHKGRLPDARAMLYEDAVDILLWRWDQIKAAGERTQPRLTELMLSAGRAEMDLKRVLGRLAFEAHKEEGVKEGEALADIKEWQLQKALAELHPEKSLDWTAQLINTIKLRAGLLIEREPGVYTFPHRTFQEFLAGTHLSNEADFAMTSARLAEQGAFWREVILLAVGRLVYLAGDLSRPLVLVSELCPKGTKQTEVDWRKVWLAGEVLVEIGVQRAKEGSLGRELLGWVPDSLVQLLQAGALTTRERAAAGNTLARLGDPRFDPGVWFLPNDERLGFVEIPKGPFIMGEGEKPDKPELGKYFIGRYPVTVAQYQEFVNAGGYGFERYWEEAITADVWKDGRVKGRWASEPRNQPENFGEPFNLENHPVVGITWYEAMAYCRWLTDKLKETKNLPGDLADVLRTGWIVRLPTEAEWEKSARGTDGRSYPWGNEEPDPDRANYDKTGIGATSAVGCFPKGASPYGALDMSGNVWEWCLTKWREDYRSNKEDNTLDGSNETRSLRGGAFYDGRRFVRCAYRYRFSPYDRNVGLGFRVVLAPEKPSVL